MKTKTVLASLILSVLVGCNSSDTKTEPEVLPPAPATTFIDHAFIADVDAVDNGYMVEIEADHTRSYLYIPFDYQFKLKGVDKQFTTEQLSVISNYTVDFTNLMVEVNTTGQMINGYVPNYIATSDVELHADMVGDVYSTVDGNGGVAMIFANGNEYVMERPQPITLKDSVVLLKHKDGGSLVFDAQANYEQDLVTATITYADQDACLYMYDGTILELPECNPDVQPETKVRAYGEYTNGTGTFVATEYHVIPQ